MACKVSLCPHPCRIITSNPSSLSPGLSLSLSPPRALHCCGCLFSPHPSSPLLLHIGELTREDHNSLSCKQQQESKLFDEANLKVRIDARVGRTEWGMGGAASGGGLIYGERLCKWLQSLQRCMAGEQINTNVALVQEWWQRWGKGTIAVTMAVLWLFKLINFMLMWPVIPLGDNYRQSSGVRDSQSLGAETTARWATPRAVQVRLV